MVRGTVWFFPLYAFKLEELLDRKLFSDSGNSTISISSLPEQGEGLTTRDVAAAGRLSRTILLLTIKTCSPFVRLAYK